VVLSPAEWQLYEDARLAALSDLETHKAPLREQERRIQILSALTRLRLLASHPRLYDPSSKLESSKLERLMELIDELRAEGHRALIFSQFTSHLSLVRDVLHTRGIPYEYLDGQTPQGARAERVRAFQEGDAPLFLISLKAGGFGLNLTAATSVIHLDPWWNPAVEDQASDRAHRIGQDRPVTVYRLVARGTIEEQMLALHEHKRALVAGVLEGKDQAGRLSTQELLALLSRKLAPQEEPPPPRARH
jgi:SNF2 family DNA or RNA helicase